MTVATTTPFVEYVENGVTTTHDIPFQFFDDEELIVTRITGDADDESEVLTLNVDYTVNGGAGSSGEIVKTDGGTNGATLRIERNTARSQLLDYQANDDFPAELHEEGLDRLEMQIQELDRDLLLPEDVRDIIGATLVAGANITITIDDGQNTITISSTVDREYIEDAMAETLVAGAGIAVTHQDELNRIVISSLVGEILANMPDCVKLSGDAQTNSGSSDVDTARLTTEDVQDIVGAQLVGGTGISIAYNDAAGTVTITNTLPEDGSSSADAELIRDTIGAALTAGTNITITVNDAGDTITIATDALDADYRHVIPTAKAAAFNFADADGGKGIEYTGAAASATIIDANLPTGWTCPIYNNGSGVLTIARNGNTLRVNGGSVTKDAALAVNGWATLWKVKAGLYVISGPGVS